MFFSEVQRYRTLLILTMFLLFPFTYSIHQSVNLLILKCKVLDPRLTSVAGAARLVKPLNEIHSTLPSAPLEPTSTKRGDTVPLVIGCQTVQPVVLTEAKASHRPSAWRYLWHVLVSEAVRKPPVNCFELGEAFRFQPLKTCRKPTASELLPS